MSFRYLLYIAITVAGILQAYGQADVVQCKENCNLGICMQLDGDAQQRRFLGDVAISLARASYGDSQCFTNNGLVWYSDNVVNGATCDMFPHVSRLDTKLQCLREARNVARATPLAPGGNNLEACLSYVNTNTNWLATAHSGQCRYTLVVIASRTLANPTEVTTLATNLKNKGAVIHCVLIGPESTTIDPAYAGFCSKTPPTTYANVDDLWQSTGDIYPTLECCGPPVNPAPTTAPATTTLAPLGPCDGCKIVNGVGYNQDADCNCFQRCYFKEDGSVTNVKQCCPCGMFWDQDILSCMIASDTRCARDSCAAAGNPTAYAFNGNCRTYWTCDGGRTLTSQCCAFNEEFNPTTQQCEQDTNGDCAASCMCDEPTTATYDCRFQYNPLDKFTFFVIAHDGTQLQLMPCARGTSFNRTTCQCSNFEAVAREKCPIDFHLNCSEIPVRDHANRVYIHNFDVMVNTRASDCTFTTQSRFLIPRYANMDFMYSFAIAVKFHPGTNVNSNAPLVSNTDCMEPSSIELRLMDGFILQGYLKTTEGEYTASVSYRENEANEAFLSLDNDVLRLTVRYADGNTQTDSVTQARGRVLRCKCAMQIGYGYPSRYYEGNIMDVKVYLCPPSSFHPAK